MDYHAGSLARLFDPLSRTCHVHDVFHDSFYPPLESYFYIRFLITHPSWWDDAFLFAYYGSSVAI